MFPALLHLDMRHDETAPAVVRAYNETDRDVSVIHKMYDTVTFTRGMGDSGRRIAVVSHDCPKCSFDRMTREHRVSPADRDTVEYYCLNPACVHYLEDTFGYAQAHRANEPTVVE